MKYSFCAFLMVMLFIHAKAQPSDELLIKQLMSNQETAWNKGNIEAFMQGYLATDSLLFVGSKGVRYGWESTLQHYKRGYPDTASMGKLHFENLEFKRLSNEYYFVLGKWHLTRSIENADGYYTLVLRKIKGSWYIVADHSS